MALPHCLVIDQGGHSTRGLVFGGNGQVIVKSQCAIDTTFAKPGRVEQDGEALAASVDTVLNDIATQLGDDVKLINRAGLVTQRSSLVCWNRLTGVPLSPVLSWQDTRAANELNQLKLDDSDIARRTGLRPNAHFGASKLRWCLNHIDAVRQACDEQSLACGPLASFLLFRLSKGAIFSVDDANAARTMLVNIDRGDWDQQLLERFQIPPSVLPSIKPTLSHFGMLNLANHPVPIRLVNGDQCAAFFRYGDLRRNTLYINAGTGAFIATPSADSASVPNGLLKTLVCSTPSQKQFVIEGTVNGAVSALDWARSELGLVSYRDLDVWCESETHPPLFINGVGGLGAPYWRAKFPSHFIDHATAEATNDSRPQSKMVAVLESIVFLLAVNCAQLRQSVTNEKFDQIRLGGGLSQLNAFAQKLADLSGLTVYRDDQQETTAFGAAWLLADGPSDWPTERGQRFEPQSNSALHQRFDAWKIAMDTLIGESSESMHL